MDRRIQLPESQVCRGSEDFWERDKAEKAQDLRASGMLRNVMKQFSEEKVGCHWDMESDILDRAAEQ